MKMTNGMGTISYLIIFGALWYGLKNIDALGGSFNHGNNKPASMESVKSFVANTFENPVATSKPATAEPTTNINTKSNPTPSEIISPKNCAGMDCYPDLTETIPVIVASNIND